MNKFFALFFSLILAILLISPAQASEAFNPEFLISDAELLDYNSMTVQEIQNFLQSKNSYLATYKTWDANNELKTAAEIIYNAAVANYDCSGVDLSSTSSLLEKQMRCTPFTTISPKFLLALLQKEQGLIENANPEEGRLNWATGYGCPDGGGCNARWKGFGKQVNSAALQFKDYMVNPQSYYYKVGKTYTFTNPYSSSVKAATVVTPTNQATAALYNFTPHVYNGNYNFWVIWNRFFRTSYPNGSLLQVKGEAGVWLIQNGIKRPFLSWTAFVSRFDPKKILKVDAAVLARYTVGASLRFPQYSIVMDPDAKLYLLVDDIRRPFTSLETFKQIGYNPEEILTASWEDINSYHLGKEINPASAYPTGALLQDNQTGGIYWVFEDTKAPVWDKIFLEAKFKSKKVSPVSPAELEKYQTIEPVKFNDGELIKIDKAPGVYVVDNGKLKAIKSGDIFTAMGYKWENVISVSPKVFLLYVQDEPIEVLGAVPTE